MLQELLCVDSKEKVTSVCPAASATETRERAGAHSAVQVPRAARSNPSRGTGRKAARAAPSILLSRDGYTPFFPRF